MLKEFKKGFTLAEVLIVIGIIGVVAALTLPNLNHATGDKEKVTKVKKIYSALTEAVDRAQVIYGDFDTWGNGLSTNAEKDERFAKRVTEFMKVSKDCGLEAGCFSNALLLNPDGTEYSDMPYLSSLQNLKQYMVILSDGISLRFSYADNYISTIGVDIDGPNRGKNQIGNDIFDFTINTSENELSEHGAPINQLIPSWFPYNWTGAMSDYNQTAWVIENGNLDYLKCPEELNWETKTSCE